jgi:hypothetical protein
MLLLGPLVGTVSSSRQGSKVSENSLPTWVLVFSPVTLHALCHSVRLLLWPCRPQSLDAAYSWVAENELAPPRPPEILGVPARMV